MAKQLNQEYSIRQLAKARELSAESVNPQPVFMPVGRIRPETFNQALERIMTASIGTGMTFQEAFDQLRPSYDYDGDFSESFEYDVADEFEQSEFAEYEREPAEPALSASAPAPTAPSVAPQNAGAPAQESGADDESALADNADI